MSHLYTMYFRIVRVKNKKYYSKYNITTYYYTLGFLLLMIQNRCSRLFPKYLPSLTIAKQSHKT